jgi:hypothetical protein
MVTVYSPASLLGKDEKKLSSRKGAKPQSRDLKLQNKNKVV